MMTCMFNENFRRRSSRLELCLVQHTSLGSNQGEYRTAVERTTPSHTVVDRSITQSKLLSTNHVVLLMLYRLECHFMSLLSYHNLGESQYRVIRLLQKSRMSVQQRLLQKYYCIQYHPREFLNPYPLHSFDYIFKETEFEFIRHASLKCNSLVNACTPLSGIL